MKNIYLKTEKKTFKEIVEFAHKKNVGIEYLMSFDDYKSLDFLISSGVNFTVHCLFFDIDLASLNPVVRKASIKYLKEVIQICNELIPDNLVIHHNYAPYKYAFKEGYFIDKFIEGFLDVIEDKKDYKISLENVYEIDSNVAFNIVDRLSKYDKGGDVGLCFDCGHFNLFSEEYIHSWLKKWDKKLFSFHLHNNYGYHDEHNVIFEGTFNLYEIKDYLKNRILTIENRTLRQFEISLNYLIELMQAK
jgi:sugar phosphate isomerase/epimerase